MSKKQKKPTTRVDFTKLPSSWQPSREIEKKDALEMDMPMGDKLPRYVVYKINNLHLGFFSDSG